MITLITHVLFDYLSGNIITDFPFEFRALEIALEGICSSLDAQTRELEVAAYPALDELTTQVKCSSSFSCCFDYPMIRESVASSLTCSLSSSKNK